MNKAKSCRKLNKSTLPPSVRSAKKKNSQLKLLLVMKRIALKYINSISMFFNFKRIRLFYE